MDTTKPYLHIGSAADLKGTDKFLYRLFEILPGLLSWGTLLGVVFASWKAPVAAAIFIIVFDLYWLIKTVFLSVHLRANHRRLKEHMATDWEVKLQSVKRKAQSERIYQLVLLPFYNESEEVVRESLESLRNTRWPKERMFVVLACEELASLRPRFANASQGEQGFGGQGGGYNSRQIAEQMQKEFGLMFGAFLVTAHPAGVPDELPGKGSNIAYAAREAVVQLVEARSIPYESVLVSAFDIDTHAYPDYFLCLAYHFLTAEHPHHSSFQPVPMYNNNMWDAPALSRVVATSGTFWQMMQQERPERLSTFSSHSMSLRSLADVGFWQNNIVSEDSRIFWNHLLYYNGNYRVVPLSYPVSLDANIG